MFSKLQYISQGSDQLTQIMNIQAALNGGCKWIQLRYKSGNEQQVFDLAKEVKALCNEHNAVFIVNDHVRIAREVGAHGVHLDLMT